MYEMILWYHSYFGSPAAMCHLHKCDVDTSNTQCIYTDNGHCSKVGDLLCPAVKPLKCICVFLSGLGLYNIQVLPAVVLFILYCSGILTGRSLRLACVAFKSQVRLSSGSQVSSI